MSDLLVFFPFIRVFSSVIPFWDLFSVSFSLHYDCINSRPRVCLMLSADSLFLFCFLCVFLLYVCCDSFPFPLLLYCTPTSFTYPESESFLHSFCVFFLLCLFDGDVLFSQQSSLSPY